MKKPPTRVRSIRNESVAPDLVTQAQLAELADLQAIAWEAHGAASKRAATISARIREGAVIEPGNWGFDTELEMARRKRKEGAG